MNGSADASSITRADICCIPAAISTTSLSSVDASVFTTVGTFTVLALVSTPSCLWALYPHVYAFLSVVTTPADTPPAVICTTFCKPLSVSPLIPTGRTGVKDDVYDLLPS